MEGCSNLVEFLCLACGTQGTRLVEGEVEEKATSPEPGPEPGFSCPRCGSRVLQLVLSPVPAGSR